MSLKVDTQIVGSVAIPEYVKPATHNNELETYKKSITDAYNSYLHPVEEVQDGNKSSLEQRAQALEGFADEHRILANVVKSKL